jgi:hypothetical protein
MTKTDNKAILASYEEELAGVTEEEQRLVRKKAALQKAISGVRELISLNGGGAHAAESLVEVPVIARNAFQRMEIVEASVAYLRIVKKPQATRELVAGLLQGGYRTHAKSFRDTVRSVLSRDARKPESKLLWTNDKWELKEWLRSAEDPTEEQVKQLFG